MLRIVILPSCVLVFLSFYLFVFCLGITLISHFAKNSDSTPRDVGAFRHVCCLCLCCYRCATEVQHVVLCNCSSTIVAVQLFNIQKCMYINICKRLLSQDMLSHFRGTFIALSVWLLRCCVWWVICLHCMSCLELHRSCCSNLEQLLWRCGMGWV